MKNIKLSLVALAAFAMTAGFTYANQSSVTQPDPQPDCWSPGKNQQTDDPDVVSSSCDEVPEAICCHKGVQTFYRSDIN